VAISNIAVLAIVGDPDAYAPVLEWIQRRGIDVDLASSAQDGLTILESKGADLILLGLPLPDALAAQVIAGIRRRDTRATIVVVGKDEDVASQIAAVELGAQEYVSDPVDARRDLLFALGVTLGVRRSDAHFRVLRGREAAAAQWRRIVAGCPAMVDVMKRLRELCEWTLSGATPTVLVTGAHGTGKRTLARALHYNGARRNRAFVEINCAALAPDTLRTELFGEIHGAARQGLLEIADGGTIFLDEIESVPLGVQRELLTAIEGRQICRVGSTEPIVIDVQFVAATRADLADIVKRSEFRSDLYHRLSVRTLALPTLRERGGDILGIAEAVISDLAGAYNMRPPQLHDDAALALLGYSWPGNIHELRNELEHVMLHLDGGTTIRAEHLRFRRNAGAVATSADSARLDVTIAGDRVPLDRLEREVIRQALARNDGNISRTARFLAITRQTLLYRLKKHGLRVPAQATD
jgi:DNA-binding NtrC family response regulator